MADHLTVLTRLEEDTPHSVGFAQPERKRRAGNLPGDRKASQSSQATTNMEGYCGEVEWRGRVFH